MGISIIKIRKRYIRLSYFYDGNPYTGKMKSFYVDMSQVQAKCTQNKQKSVDLIRGTVFQWKKKDISIQHDNS